MSINSTPTTNTTPGEYPDVAYLQVRIRKGLNRDVRVLAAQQDMSLTEVVTRALQAYVAASESKAAEAAKA